VRWLIDGYNVIRRDPDLRAREAESLESGRAALLRLLAGVARDSGEPFVAVFDGARRAGAAPAAAPNARVQVVFSRPPETADDVLMRLAGEWREGGVVVSSDRTIHQAARRAGAVAVTTDEFLAALEPATDLAQGDDAPVMDWERGRGGPRGNPHRLSKDARAARRVLRRLRPR
jgi:predicted RNA-binding protein with PIN domain